MARSTKLMVVSAVACALTLAVFMASYGSLPGSVPVQFGLAGEANSYWPREAVVFGMPAVFVLVDIVAGLSLSKREDARAWMHWIVPAVAFAATGLVILMGTK